MKKIFFSFVSVILCLFLVGCSGGQSGSATSSDDQNNAEVGVNAKAEITQNALKTWAEYETTYAHGAIEITNTGDVSILIGDISMSFVDQDGNIVKTSTFALPVPEILIP